jgi:protein TonB
VLFHRQLLVSYYAPTAIPKSIPPPADEVTTAVDDSDMTQGAAEGVEGGISGGVPGGIVGGVPGGLLGGPPAPLPPPPPKPERHAPIVVPGTIEEAKLIHRVEPVYPRLAALARISGIVILEVTVDEKGNVSDVEVLRGDSLLDPAAVAAVKQWKYAPTILDGQPVPVIATVTVDFQLVRK